MHKHSKIVAILDGVASIVGFGRSRVHAPETARVLRQLDQDASEALFEDSIQVGNDLTHAIESSEFATRERPATAREAQARTRPVYRSGTAAR